MIVVSDTSPITALLQIGQAGLLHQLYHEVIVPEAVGRELRVTHASLPDFIRIERATDEREVTRLCVELDTGEAEAIVLAKRNAR